MKIAIGIHYFPPHVGGMEIVAKTQAKLFAAKGHDVTVLTSSVGGTPGLHTQDGYRLMRVSVWNFFERRMGVPYPFFSPSLLWRGYQIVKRVDVVHVHDVFYQTSFVMALWAKVLRKPIVVTQHVAMIPHPNMLVRFVQWLTYRTTGRFVFSTSKRVTLLNAGVRDFLIALGVPTSKLVFIPNGVDMTLFRPGKSSAIASVRKRYALPTNQPIALFVGRFVPKKGFHKLLDATSPDYHIALAGGNAPAGITTNADQVTFLGALTPQELAEVYTAVDIFILPSEGEGFPLTIQEAMAARLPIVTSKDPGYAIYNLDPKLFMQITPTVEAITIALTKLSNDPRQRAAMAEYSHTYATEHFSWDTNSNELLSIFEDIR